MVKQDFGLQRAKSPPPPFGDNCWPLRLLIAFPSTCRVYQQSVSPRQLSSMLLADLLRVYTEKRSQLCHSLTMKKSSAVFFLWSLKGISDLELLENQQTSPWFNFQRHWLNSPKAVIMLAEIKRTVPKKNKNTPPTKFYCLVTREQKALQRESRNALSPHHPWYTTRSVLVGQIHDGFPPWPKEIISSVSISLI